MKNALEKSGHILIETTEDIIDKVNILSSFCDFFMHITYLLLFIECP